MVVRQQITTQQIRQTLDAFEDQLSRRLAEKGFGAFASPLEALGSITEEYHEVIAAEHSHDVNMFESELTDLAIACVFAVACIRAGAMWSR